MADHPNALLHTLLDQAQADRDRAASALRQAEAQATQARQQANDLHDYRCDHDQRWLARFQQTGTLAGGPELLHCHRNFGQRLDQAIGLQTGHAQQLDQRLQQARAVLLARDQRVASVRKLIARRQAEQLKVTQRRDQRSTDEAAQRAHGNRAGPHPLTTLPD